MKEKFNERVKECFPLKNGILLVKIKDDTGVDDYDTAKLVNTLPSHFGSYLLSHSSRLMNDVIKQRSGFYNIGIYYTDTDSCMYILNTGLTWLTKDSSLKLLAFRYILCLFSSSGDKILFSDWQIWCSNG